MENFETWYCSISITLSCHKTIIHWIFPIHLLISLTYEKIIHIKLEIIHFTKGIDKSFFKFTRKKGTITQAKKVKIGYTPD
jgi:hypothetical protein